MVKISLSSKLNKSALLFFDKDRNQNKRVFFIQSIKISIIKNNLIKDVPDARKKEPTPLYILLEYLVSVQDLTLRVYKHPRYFFIQ